MVGTVTTYIVSNSSSPIGGTFSVCASGVDDLGHGIAVTDDEREPAAILTQHAAREFGGTGLRIDHFGLHAQALDEIRGRLLGASRVRHVDPLHAAELLAITEHLREAHGALLARRRQRRIRNGADLLSPHGG